MALNSLAYPALAVPPPPPPPPAAEPALAPKPAEPAPPEKPKKKPAPAPKPAAAGARPAPPRPVALPATAPTPAPAATAAAPSSAELQALREEVKSLREDLNRAVGGPAAAPAPADTSAERASVEAELDAEEKRLASIQAAVAAGLDPNTVADAVKKSEARIAELEASLAKLAAPEPTPAAPPASVRSLHEVSLAVNRLDAKLAEKPPAQLAVAVEKPRPAEVPGEEQEKAALLPLELTAFGDFHYGFYQNAPDGFGIGAVEVDASLNLTPFVLVSVALAYSGEDDAFGLGAFVVDCGLAGEGEGFLIQSHAIQQSGVAFGKFDVPFGIAYLEYAAVDNRLASTPEAVLATHGAWSDLGMQAHAVGRHWTALAYLVNGPEVPVVEDTTVPSLTALGGRVSGKLDGVFEVGGSLASTFADGGVDPLLYAGGDVTGIVGPLDVRAEYLLRRTEAPGATPNTHGVYGRAVLELEPAFLVGRFDGVYADADPVDRRVAGGAGVVVFPQGEVRAVYNQSLDLDDRSVVIELVGGSTFQPTGLRR